MEHYSSDRNHIPFLRRFESRGFNILVQAMLGFKVNETRSGYKIMKAELARKSFDSMTVTNTFYGVALLYKTNILAVELRRSQLSIHITWDANTKFSQRFRVMACLSSLSGYTILLSTGKYLKTLRIFTTGNSGWRIPKIIT